MKINIDRVTCLLAVVGIAEGIYLQDWGFMCACAGLALAHFRLGWLHDKCFK